ncbi:MAG: hypothetical protein LDL31_05205, partial [Prosthecobacter sp.]|nr:hypothetical protein [Prosthecobacter sp.]
SATIEPYQDRPSAREELVPFLMGQFQGEGACDGETWLRRMAYWWDENPYAQAHPCRGWVLRSSGRVAGYLGTIPTLYEDAEGRQVPALIATSWAVEEGQRQAALPMGLLLQRQGRHCLLIDTTPSPEVQQLLLRWGWIGRTSMRRTLVLRGAAGAVLAGFSSREPPLWPPGLRVVTDLEPITHLRQSGVTGQLHKSYSLESLRWYLRSPMRRHFMVGLADDRGGLHAFLILTNRPMKGIPTWKVLDWYSAEAGPDMPQLLAWWLMDQAPDPEGVSWPFLNLTSFPGQQLWDELPSVYARDETVCHFYHLPPALAGQSIRSVMAEGDWGL